MFCVQFRIALINLFNPPTVDSTNVKNIEEIDLPLITICPTNQTNKNMLEMYFPDSDDSFLSGYCGQYSPKEVLRIVFMEQFAAKTKDTFDEWITSLDYETGEDIYLRNKNLHSKVCWDRPRLYLTYMDL